MSNASSVAPDPEATPLAYSVNAFAKALGVGRSKIYEEIRDGRLQAKKLGSRTLITAQAARDYLSRLPDLAVIDKASQIKAEPKGDDQPEQRQRERLALPAPATNGHARAAGPVSKQREMIVPRGQQGGTDGA